MKRTSSHGDRPRLQINEDDLPTPTTLHQPGAPSGGASRPRPGRPATAPTHAGPGAELKLSGFKIVAVAGRGGMGIVYRATQLSLQRTVALKLIREDLASRADYRERFLREARLAAAISHPNVVSVFDVAESNGQLVLVMQWVEGETLRRRLSREGALRPVRAVALAQQLGSAVDAVHAAGLVHRDVKPANVLLTTVSKRDHAYLGDFGIANAPSTADRTVGGGAMGTAGYMAPEQIAGREATARSDLYAVGCIAFEMLAGTQPFTGEDEDAVSSAHADEPRPRLSAINGALDERFDSVLMSALSVDPAARFESGRALADALMAALAVRTTTRPRARG